MYRGRSVYVIIPCYNVAGHIQDVVAAVPPEVDGIITVEDGSTDTTADVLKRIGDTRTLVIPHSKNGGVGAAMVTGFRAAADRGADILVKVDGDGQMDLAYLPTLLDAIIDGEHDYAKGNRLLHREGLAQMPRARRVGNLVMTILTKLASGYWHVLDPQNGFVAIKRSTWLLLDHKLIDPGYFFENDMLVQLNIVDARIKDIPMPARYGSERSGIRLRRVIPRFLGLLIRRTGYRFYTKYILRDFSPIALFVLAGLPLMLWGAGFGAWAWWQSVSTGVTASTGTVMLSVLPLIIGFQLLLQALVLDITQCPR